MVENSRYAMNEGSLPLDVPGTWEDQTIHVLRLPGDGKATASLVVTREVLPVGMEVPAYMQVELKRLKDTLPGFELRGRIPIRWSDTAGDALLTRWRSAEGSMDQILTCRRSEGRRLLVFTATHPTPFPTPAYEALLRAISGFTPHPLPSPAAASEPG